MFRHALTHRKAVSVDKGKYADGQGLWLSKRRKNAGSWILRLTINGRRREMGLGSWPDVSIAEARDRAHDARKAVRYGEDPIEKRREQRRTARSITVREAIESCFKARQVELKHDGTAGRWLSPLQTHIIPKIGHLPINTIDQHKLKQVLAPIWHTKATTASKALIRFNITLKHAVALGIDVDIQATAKAKALLGKQRHQVQHIPSLPYQEMPEFYRWLSTKDTTAALALRFLVLTVARTSEVRLATFDEFGGDVWVLAPERTKTGREHRIPLTNEAQLIIKQARQRSPNQYVFPTLRDKPMSDAAMAAFLKREAIMARPHGFRASFRTWVEEQTDTPFEVKESALGHVTDSKVVQAYQRSDRLEKRRGLMEGWEGFLVGSNRYAEQLLTVHNSISS